MKITTKWKIQVVERDVTGYYYPVYRTDVTVIADTKEEAYEKALDRTSKRTNSSGYEQGATVLSFEDMLVESHSDEMHVVDEAGDQE